jgi:phenylacetate-coenzyme A ligase PaaK-like adenylate-forming protein
VLLTALHSRAMPFIRYRIGDSARRPAAPPRCRLRFAALDLIEGRITEYLRLPGGRRVNPSTLMYALDVIDGLGRWQAVQRVESSVELCFETLPGADPDQVARMLETRARGVVPPEVGIVTRRVAAFPEDGAKRRAVRWIGGGVDDASGAAASDARAPGS